MNTYIRNSIITLIVNVVIFIIGWGCIVPDQMMDQTHLFGLIGSYEIVKGNTAVVFGMCALLSTLTLIVSLVEAIVEDYSRPRFCPTRVEKPKKSPKPGVSGMRIEPTSENIPDKDPKTPEKGEKICDEDPKTPTLD